MKKLLALLIFVAPFTLSLTVPFHAQAQDMTQNTGEIEELNPFDPNVEQTLKDFDRVYEEETGLSPFISSEDPGIAGCKRGGCAIWLQIVKSSQRAYLYINGSLSDSWLVSTGIPGYGTPNFDKHPNGRIYDRYNSTKFPGGDWQGLGNMPYAVFIKGGFAVHGTPQGNWSKLGRQASHGCIRMHPDNAYRFNRLVRSYGVSNVWITVQ